MVAQLRGGPQRLACSNSDPRQEALGRGRVEYVFDRPTGKQTLSDLFDGRSQLLVYHFMFGPDWEQGCPSCSFWADNYNGVVVHLAHRDATLVAVSRARRAASSNLRVAHMTDRDRCRSAPAIRTRMLEAA